MKRYILISVVIFFTSNILLGQSTGNLKDYKPKKIISTVEFFGGLAANFPNAKGWDDYVSKGTNGQVKYQSEARTGYSFGVSLIHSINERFELQGRVSVEQRKFFDSYLGFDNNGALYSEHPVVQKNKYFALSVVPTYFFSNTTGLHVFAGITYLNLTKSLSIGEIYVNGQYIGGSQINTIDAFEKSVFDAVAGVGYLFRLNRRFSSVFRIQGNYGLSNTMVDNEHKMSMNSLSMSIAIRYNK